MKLISLELENFRQYYGNQKINFASGKEKNITIIFGENGKGKTGIYRAIMFVLFGLKHISQDDDSERVHLTNFKYLDEISPLPGKSNVKLKFLHNETTYVISRSIKAFKDGKRVTERDGDVELNLINEFGNYDPKTINDSNEVKLKINKVMSEEIKDFFLFDAEKIDTLAKADPKVRKEVKEAIFKMVQIDSVIEAEKLLKRYEDELRRSLNRQLKDDNLDEKNKRLEDIESEMEQISAMLNKLEAEKLETQKVISNNQLVLEKNKDIENIKKEISSRQNNIFRNEEGIAKLKERITKNALVNAPYLIMRGTLEKSRSELENFLGNNKINVPLDLIQESIDQNRCLACDNDLSNNEENKMYMEMLLGNQKNTESYILARELIQLSKNKLPDHEEDQNEIWQLLKDYNQLLENINEENEIIKILKSKIMEQARNDVNLSEIHNIIEKEKSKEQELTRDIIIKEEKIKEYSKELTELKLAIQEIYNRQSKMESEKEQVELLIKMTDGLKEISGDFKAGIRNTLGKYTTEIFDMLIDSSDNNVIHRVEIDGNFEIKAYNSNGLKVTQDISQGQRQILSLSFITALAKASVNEDEIDYPLFMDSPFNRLSGMNRDNLINKLPDLTSQWILLLTDTELTQNEEKVFKATNRLGKWYRIIKISPEHSKIEEVPLNEAMATRGGM